ncbi:MAG: MurR/RpiR family transcriptional regulator [Sphingopyxis sp.]|uniref:MurR/RpiR family transcriptional regulator n=1 Tax=Sphingopyxis sp. TaxID=1908224 RepID=UPI002AB80860|nr:MurR/RpiR family transcriptional regulator [Sphingopyxis sp.]MDZ3832198.1 MurR/RpiR family transcriptional regulator [Sphingopyxis sp.]
MLSRIRMAHPGLPKGARRIADYVIEHAQDVMQMSVTDLAEATSSSEGSVVNFCKKLGLSGFQQLKLGLAQESVKPVQFIHEDLDEGDDMATVCRKIFHSGIQALSDSLSVLDHRMLEQAVAALHGAKRIEIYGIGSSAPIAEDAQYRMLRIGLDVKAITDSHVQAISASRTSRDVAVLTISHSGATHETVTATKLAKDAGATTIAITNYGRSPIHAHADHVLFTMARETRFRTEAMTSRIAQLCVVDALIAGLALQDYDRSIAALQSTFDVLSVKRF